MAKTTSKNFKIARELKPSEDKSVYGFGSHLDKDSIREAINYSNGHMPSFFLSKIEFHPSGFCNLKCPHCYGEKLAPEYCNKRNIPIETIEEVLKDVKVNLPDTSPLIILSGSYSEPLMHPKLNRIIDSIGERNFRFGLYTNGLQMKDELINGLLEAANNSSSEKPCFISFDVSGSLNVDRFIRELSPIMEQILKKRRGLENKLEVDAPLIISQKNNSYDFWYGIVGRLESIGVDNIRLSIPWNKIDGIQTRKYESIPKKELIKTMEVFHDLERDFEKVRIRYPQQTRIHKKCYAMSISLTISPEGEVYPCPEVSILPLKDRFSYGNVHEKKLSEIWQSKEHFELFERLNPKEGNCLCCPVYDEFNLLCEQLK